MNFHRACDGAHCSRSDAVFACCLKCRLAQFWMRGQAEVIVRSEVDDFFAVERADRCLLVFEHAQPEMGAFGLKIIQLIGEVRKRIGAGRCCDHALTSEIHRRGSTRKNADWKLTSLILQGRGRNEREAKKQLAPMRYAGKPKSHHASIAEILGCNGRLSGLRIRARTRQTVPAEIRK